MYPNLLSVFSPKGIYGFEIFNRNELGLREEDVVAFLGLLRTMRRRRVSSSAAWKFVVDVGIGKAARKIFSYLTNLPGASEKLSIFTADFDNLDSFREAIEGCVGFFHVAHLVDFSGNENIETITKKSVDRTIGFLQACLDSKTVKRVVYTSSTAAVMFENDKGLDVLDENSWSDADYIKSLIKDFFVASYSISKTMTEKAALEFAEKHALDLLTVLPTFIHGPFITPSCPGLVQSILTMITGNESQFRFASVTHSVHIDDVASAHIYLFECPEAKGRYICSAVETKADELFEFVSKRYPEYQISPDLLTDRAGKAMSFSSKKLLDTGFRYKYGLEEMLDGAIECCKQKGFL